MPYQLMSYFFAGMVMNSAKNTTSHNMGGSTIGEPSGPQKWRAQDQ